MLFCVTLKINMEANIDLGDLIKLLERKMSKDD